MESDGNGDDDIPEAHEEHDDVVSTKSRLWRRADDDGHDEYGGCSGEGSIRCH